MAEAQDPNSSVPLSVLNSQTASGNEVDQVKLMGRGSTHVWEAAEVTENYYNDILGSPTLCLKCGNIDADTSLLILIIPGCPGVAHIYKDFMRQLHVLSRLPVWCVCHAGHVSLPDGIPEPTCEQDIYDLEGQIKHKVEFIEQKIENHIKVVLIGHQLGAHMVLEMLKFVPRQQVLRGFLLFPIIEGAEHTDGAKKMMSYLYYGRWAIKTFVTFLSMTRQGTANYFIQWFYGTNKLAPCVLKGCNRLIDPDVMQNVLHLLEEQIHRIKEADYDVIDRNIEKLCFYYGTTDEWVPTCFCERMAQKYPSATIKLDPEGFRAEFYTKTRVSKTMAEICWDWVTTAY